MEKPIIDVEGVMERVDNDVELYVTLVDILKSDAPGKLEGLRTSSAAKDSAAVRELAHSIKSALGNLGAMRGHDIAYKLEMAGRDDRVEELSQLVSELQASIEEFYAEFDRVKNTLG